MKIRRQVLALLAAGLMAAGLSACQDRQGPEAQPETPPEQGEQSAQGQEPREEQEGAASEEEGETAAASADVSKAPAISSPEAELKRTDGTLLLYEYLESGIYKAEEEIPLQVRTNLYDVFLAVAQNVLPAGEMPPVNSVTQEKGFVVWDLSGQWLETYDKGELELFCNSLYMTVMQNVQSIDSMQFTVDGEEGLLGGDVWEAAPLQLLENPDAAAFDAIRAQIPYPGLKGPEYLTAEESNYRDLFPQELREDETAREIQRVLALAGDLGTFEAAENIDQKTAITYLLWATPYVSSDPAEGDAYWEELIPLAAAVSQELNFQETWFWMKEHIEESARLLFGDSMTVVHQEPSLPYSYFEDYGVYTPPHMGGGWNIIPVILSYEEEGDTVTAQVVYLMDSMGGLMDSEDRGSGEMPEYLDWESALDYAQNTARQREVILRREGDGRLTIQSCRYL